MTDLNSFPTPPSPSDTIYSSEPGPDPRPDTPEPILTDPVVSEIPTEPSPIFTKLEPEPALEVEPAPATLPVIEPKSSSGKLTVIFLSLLAIGAVAAAVAIFFQLTKVKDDYTALNSIKNNQNTPTPTTPVQTPKLGVSTPTSTPTPTPIIKTKSSLDIFPSLKSIIDLATGKVSTAKLLMITVENVQSPEKMTAKYWFRESETKKTYFYVLTQPGSEPVVFDQQIYVTPDNNIPALNGLVMEEAIIYDLDTVYNLVNTTIIDKSALKTDPTQVIAQLINTKVGASNVLLWQLTYRYLDRTSPVIAQINARSKEIIYTNLKYTK